MRSSLVALLLLSPLFWPTISLAAPPDARLRVSVMAGFIKDPQHFNYTVPQWAKGIGARFDARAFVARVKQAGASEIIWYDKWIDGLVFRHTKTTGFQTERDFLSELAPECKRQGIKLVIYFNTFTDGNPEYEQWSCTDQQGKPIPWGPTWPCNMPSRFSPFREKVLEQIRELVADHKIDGLWIDVPRQPPICYDRWTREAFRARMGKFPDESTPAERLRFSLDAAAEWNQEVAAFVRKLNPAVTFTTNGVYDATAAGPRHTIGKAQPLDYMSGEMHVAGQQHAMPPILADYLIPAEAGILLSSTWFTAISGPAPTCARSPRQVQQEAAVVLGTGINLYLAITLAHDGTFDEPTLQQVEVAGKWLQSRRAYLDGARKVSDVAIVLGTADPSQYFWPGAGESNYGAELYELEAKLRDAGYLPMRLLNAGRLQRWTAIPHGIRTVILPDRVSLTAQDAGQVRRFVAAGGKAVAFARGSGLTVSGDAVRPDEVFGARSAGFVDQASRGALQVSWKGEVLPISRMLHIIPKPAETLLWAKGFYDGAIPLLAVNRAGKGAAYFSAAPESAFEKAPAVLDHLWREAIGDPAWKCAGKPGSYLARVHEKDGKRIVHFIREDLAGHESYEEFSLNTEVLPFDKATVVPDNYPLTVKTSGKWKSFELIPSPEVMVRLE